MNATAVKSLLVLALTIGGLSPMKAATDNLDQPLPIPVISTNSLQQNASALKGKIGEDAHARFMEAISYIFSFSSSQKYADESNKEKLQVLLLASKTPREIILIGHLLLACELDRTLSGEIKLSLDDRSDPSKSKQAIIRHAAVRREWCARVIEEYTKQH